MNSSSGSPRSCEALLRATFALLLILPLVLAPASGWAYHHHASKVRFQEYSAAAFEGAKREGKPIFMLISAVWCYWCNYFEKNTLETDEVWYERHPDSSLRS